MPKINKTALIKTIKLPDMINEPTNITAKMAPKRFNFTILFLLGVIGCKWWINYRHQRIRVFLPESKRYIARVLKLNLGGTVCTVRKGQHTGVMWQTANGETISKIVKAARKFKSWLPLELVTQFERFAASQHLE